MINVRLPVGDEPETTERIVTAAIDLFARDGYARTTVRQIAAAAGVSPGLVIHRFGDKEKLRDACDDAVLAEITSRQRAELASADTEAADTDAADGQSDRAGFLRLRRDPAMLRLADYLAQMVMDRTRGADHLFDALVQRTREVLAAELPHLRARPTDDPEAVAVLVAAHSLVEVIWRHQFARRLGSPTDPDGAERLAGPLLQLYTRGVVEPDPPRPTRDSSGPEEPSTKE